MKFSSCHPPECMVCFAIFYLHRIWPNLFTFIIFMSQSSKQQCVSCYSCHWKMNTDFNKKWGRATVGWWPSVTFMPLFKSSVVFLLKKVNLKQPLTFNWFIVAVTLHGCVWKDTVPETNLFCWVYLQNNMQDLLLHLESADFLCEWQLCFCCAFGFFIELDYVMALFTSGFFRIVSECFHVIPEMGKEISSLKHFIVFLGPNVWNQSWIPFHYAGKSS